MYLKKIDIQGFKSFAKKVSFDFSEGITGFVGPNGCGKSNVVDAVKWGLGEQKVSTLRGECMQDVIFKGNGSRPPMNFAEVSLYFDNSCHTLDIEYDEVVITRRLFRTGESEYLLNRSACRLKDIKNLFLDTGIGVSAYSVMEQGRIDSVLQANPVERRAIFEEAAGISRFKARRREAERKLDRTQANLLRVGDIIDELEKRIRSLKNQAGRARSYIKCSDRLKELKQDHFIHLYEVLTQDAKKVEEQKNSAELELQRINSELVEKRENLLVLERENELHTEALADKRTDLTRVKTSLDDAQSNINYHEKRISELEVEVKELSEREIEIAASLEEKVRAQAEINERYQELTQEQKEISVEENRFTLILKEADENWNRAVEVLEKHNGEALELNRIEVDLKNKAIEADARFKGAQNSLMRMAWRTNDLADELAKVRVLLARVESELRKKEESRNELTLHLRKGKDQELALEERLQTINNDLIGITAEIIKRESRIELLHNLLESREGVGKGVRAVLEEASKEGSEFSFVKGLLGELLEVDMKYSAALEAILGATEEAIVVDNAGQAEKVMGYINNRNLSGVRLIPLDLFQTNQVQAHNISNPIIDQVKSQTPQIEKTMACLVGGIEVIESGLLTDQDLDLSKTYVTLKGDLFQRGVISAGKTQDAPGMIARKSEIIALGEELETLKAKQGELTALRNSAAQNLEEMSLENKGLAAQIEAVSEAVAQLTAEKDGRLERWDKATRELNINARECCEFEKNSLSLKNELSALKEEQDSIKTKLLHLEQVVTQSRLEVEVKQDERERVADKQRELEFRRIQHQERKEGVETEKRIVDQNVKESRIRLEDIKRDAARAANVLEETAQKLKEAKEKSDHYLKSRSTLAEEVQAMAESLEEMRSAFESRREDMLGMEEVQDAARTKLDDLRIKERENQVRLSSLTEKAMDDLDMDLEAETRKKEENKAQEAADGHGEEIELAMDWEAVEQEIKVLRERLARMGNVNLDAINELEAEETRYNGLVSQRSDLIDAIKSLEDLIMELNTESREKFVATFDAVRTHFHKIFRKLFQGGKADLKLRENEDILEAGIDVVAGPPGKDMRSINLLSGGERTLTAVGLLFALFKTRPSPFCILDEVDAALDEVNIERFCILLGDYVNESQFIIVTHSKRTMSYCDFLYGITMQENGVSTRIALNLKSYEDQVA